MLVSIKNLSRSVLGICTKFSWIGPLVVRLCIGVAFILDGWGKVNHLDGVTGYFTELNIPLAHANAVFVSWVELVAGVLLVLGFCTRIAALFLIGTMAVAFLTAILPRLDSKLDLFSTPELTYVVIFVWLGLGGAGKASLDHLLFRRWADPQVGEAAGARVAG
jgi:putative oxidoreductase